MEYQLKVKESGSEMRVLSPGEILLGLFEKRIMPNEFEFEFELLELSSRSVTDFYKYSQLSVPRASGNVGNACNPSVMQIFEPESIDSSVNSKEKGGDHA